MKSTWWDHWQKHFAAISKLTRSMLKYRLVHDTCDNLISSSAILNVMQVTHRVVLAVYVPMESVSPVRPLKRISKMNLNFLSTYLHEFIRSICTQKYNLIISHTMPFSTYFICFTHIILYIILLSAKKTRKQIGKLNPWDNCGWYKQ